MTFFATIIETNKHTGVRQVYEVFRNEKDFNTTLEFVKFAYEDSPYAFTAIVEKDGETHAL